MEYKRRVKRKTNLNLKLSDIKMKIIDLFQKVLGKEVDKNEKGFNYKADSYGVNFFVSQEDFKSISQGLSSPLKTYQHAIFKMLEENGQASQISNGFSIESDVVSSLEEDDAEILQLPSIFQGKFVTDISGHTRNSSFSLSIQVDINGNNYPYKRTGPFIYLGQSTMYRINHADLIALKALEEHLGLDSSDKGEIANLTLIHALQRSKALGMNIDLSHFDNLDINEPESISVSAIKKLDGSIELTPNLGDGSSIEDLNKRWGQIEVGADSGVLRVKNRIVLLESKKMKAIENIFSNKHIPAEQVPLFLESPTAFLDASLINLDMGFSIRVDGVGVHKHIEFGSDDLQRNDWFGSNAKVSSPSALYSILDTNEDVEQFTKALENAQKQGATTIVFREDEVDISNKEAVHTTLENIKENLNKKTKNESQDKDIAPKDEKATVSIVLKEAKDIRVEELHKKISNASLLTTPNWNDYPRTPYPHQKEGIEWILKLLSVSLQDNKDDLYRVQGGLLADDMGLGKTYMSLVAINELLKYQKQNSLSQKPILVVAPLSLLENWEDEVGQTLGSSPFKDIVVLQSNRDLKKFRAPGAARESKQLADLINEEGLIENSNSIRYALNIGASTGTKRLDIEQRLVLTTYQTLRDYQLSLCQIDWGMVLFDEAQNIKNPNTLQTRAAKGLKADFKLLITGTPVENSLRDFWCLLDTAQPGLLGDWNEFKDAWVKPIEQSDLDKRDEVRINVGKSLRDTVGQFMIRRTKEEQLSGLPTKTIYSGVKGLPLSEEVYNPILSKDMQGTQLIKYNEAIETYRESSDQKNLALQTLTNLKSISIHPFDNQENMVESINNPKEFIAQSSKFQILFQILDAIKKNKEKAIIFMVNKKLQLLLQLCLNTIYKLNIEIINGETKAVASKKDDLTRKKLISNFEEHKGFNILIMSPIAAGVGLTVTAANHVIHLERHWNPAKEAQASDRVYRIGQQKDVFIYLPISTHPEYDSFDVNLNKLLKGKIMLKDAVVTSESEEVISEELTRTLKMQ